MDILIRWQKPILLNERDEPWPDSPLVDRVAARVGVYFFSRKHGARYEPFYIGETTNLRTRFRHHLRSVPIVDVLRGHDDRIAHGKRHFHFGYYISKQAQNPKKCIKIVQKFLIQRALADELTLLNKQLVKVKTDKIIFKGGLTARGIYPLRSAVQKSKE
jgi:hypothetical protein